MAKSEKQSNEQRSFWRAIFNQSRVNGAPYRGEYLPAHSWIWPRGTFLQHRLRSVRAQESADVSSEIPAREERITALERIDRSASTRLRLVSEPRNGAVETNDNGADSRGGPLPSPGDRGDAARLSPTQALLSLERDGWARVNKGAVQRVEVNEQSVQAALHKENIEKFQATLLQSGEWVRSNDLERAVEPPPSPKPELAAAPSKTDGNTVTPQVQIAATRVEVQAPSMVRAPAPALRRAVDETVSQKGHTKSEPALDPPAVRAESRPTVQTPVAAQTAQQVPGWDDIDEKLLWLAKPSS